MNNKLQTKKGKCKALQLKSLRPLRSLRWIAALTPANEANEEMKISEFRREKPQMSADERRYIRVTGSTDFFVNTGFSVTEFIEIIYRKGRKERKVIPQESLQHSRSVTEKLMPQRYRTRMTRIGRILTDTIDPCVSVSSVQSVFYRDCSCITSIINILKVVFSLRSMNPGSLLTLRRSIYTVPYKVDASTICVHLRSSAVNNS